jgi:hypothetical protein
MEKVGKESRKALPGFTSSRRLAIEELVGEPSEANRQLRADIAASFQYAAVRHLAERTRRATAWALDEYPEVTLCGCDEEGAAAAAAATTRFYFRIPCCALSPRKPWCPESFGRDLFCDR